MLKDTLFYITTNPWKRPPCLQTQKAIMHICKGICNKQTIIEKKLMKGSVKPNKRHVISMYRVVSKFSLSLNIQK